MKYARVIARNADGGILELRDAPIYDEGMSANKAIHFGRRVLADTINIVCRKFEGTGAIVTAEIIEK